MRARLWHSALVLVALAAGCSLNPQPLPPGETPDGGATTSAPAPEPGTDAGPAESVDATINSDGGATGPQAPPDGGAANIGDSAADAPDESSDAGDGGDARDN